MDVIEVHVAEEIIKEHLGIYIELKDEGHYLLEKDEDGILVSWSQQSPPDSSFHEKIQTLEVGMVLIDTKRKKPTLMPAVMDQLKDNYPKIEITNPKIAEKFTMGQAVKINDSEEYETKQVIITYNHQPIAFGHILFGEFNSVIDVGWYLREAE